MIAPQTNIRLLNTPLENDRANSLTWNTVEEQTNYFISRTVYSYPEATYTRKGQFLRIPKNVDQLYNCNYVMYKNAGHSNKWFYAFIERIEYVNDDISYVYLIPDELQTWYFNIEFKDSFVVREHTNNDAIGANRTEENLPTGSYVVNKKQRLYESSPNIRMLIPVNAETSGSASVTSPTKTWLQVTSADLFSNRVGNVSGLYTVSYVGGVHVYLTGPSTSVDIADNVEAYGLSIDWTSISEADDSASFTLSYSGGGDVALKAFNHNILGYKMASTEFNQTGLNAVSQEMNKLIDKSLLDDLGGLYLSPNIGGDSELGTITKQQATFTPVRNLDNYVPKNNKLFCYPFTIIKMHNANDSSRVLQPEMFYDFNSMGFEYWSDKMPSCVVTAVPRNYGGASESMEYGINSAKYPLSSASYNGFQNYLGIHATEYNINVASRLASGVFNIASAGISASSGIIDGGEMAFNYLDKEKSKTFGAPYYARGISQTGRNSTTISANAPMRAVNGALEIASVLAETNARQREAYETVGAVSNTNLNASGDLNIYIEQQSVYAEYAKRIDDYFSMFGYKTNLVKHPNLTGRRNWNYVETKQCNIIGEIPNESIDNIRALFDNGVTLWHSPVTYLDYSQDNSII